MAVPKSPISDFIERVSASAALVGIPVLAGANGLAKQTAPTRIVMFPGSGQGVAKFDRRTSANIQQQLLARCWAPNLDGAWDLLRRLLHASSRQVKGGGKTWNFSHLEWDENPDTTAQGVCFTVTFSIQLEVEELADWELVTIAVVNTTLTNT